ncbi:MAG: 50S ribosomal protein L7ae [Nanoarchaeota archaeon]|nr:50S ribosomal protein L7ae [Nanoarchaeota archaeon]
MAGYVTQELPDDIQQSVLELFNVARSTGKIKKGTNEVTKAIERGTAKFVIIAGDVNPPEIVMHLAPLSEEKGIPYAFIKDKKSVGSVIGVKVGCSAAAIIEAGEGKNNLKALKEKIKPSKK